MHAKSPGGAVPASQSASLGPGAIRRADRRWGCGSSGSGMEVGACLSAK
jgi:hypothetical protein